jgi:hypothetical protein
MRLWSYIALFATTAVLGQTPQQHAKFEDYSVTQVYTGTPAIPRLNESQRSFRTRIRVGAKAPVEFAGHYTVPRFGCGTECSSFFIVDSVSGKVFDGFSVSDLPDDWLKTQTGDAPMRWEFRPNSRLFRVNGCINERDCGYYDYIMVDGGSGLKLVKKWLLPERYQH